MACSSAVPSVPHVSEKLYARLNLQDRPAVPVVCSDWETAIYNAEVPINNDLLLRIVCSDPEHHDVTAIVHQSGRSHRNVAILLSSPLGPGTWERLVELLQVLNETCAVEWLWYSAVQERDIVTGLIAMGNVFENLQELELTITVGSYLDTTWSTAFQNLKQLRSLTMHEARRRVMASVQQHCRKLRVLVLSRFALPQLRGDVLDFPCLESLTVDKLFIPNNSVYECRRTQVALPQLTDISLLTSEAVIPLEFTQQLATLRLPMLIVVAPQLVTVRLSYLLRHFVDFKVHKPRLVN